MRSSYLVLIYGIKYPDKRLSLTTFNTKNAQKALIADNWPFAEYGHIRVFLAPLQQGEVHSAKGSLYILNHLSFYLQDISPIAQ